MSQVDVDAIVALKEIMEDEFAVLLDTFFEDSQLRIAALRQTAADGDADAFRRAAHAFKGSAGNMAATGLADLCLQAENLGLSGNLDGAGQLADAIEAEYQGVVQTLAAYR